ncbi:MAG: metallophosphoesterase [Myxococcota bacterium]
MRRFSVVVFAITVVSAVLFGSHYYIATRLIIEPGVPDPWRGLLLASLVLAAASLVASPVSERTLSPALSRWIAWPASIWMGLWFWLILATAITDLGLLLLGALGVADDGPISGFRAAAVVSISVLAGVLAIRSGLSPPRDVRVEIELAGWPSALDGFRIVQITDIHIGLILDRRFARAIVDRVNALQPDLIAVTGDLVDGGVEQLADDVAPFRDLKSRYGV